MTYMGGLLCQRWCIIVTHALRTLAKSCKGLKGMTHMCTHTHKHKAPCVFLQSVSSDRAAASSRQRQLCGAYKCVRLSVCVCVPLCGLASAARVWIIISMCQNFAGMRLVMHSYLTAITHYRLSLSLFAALCLSAMQRQIAVTNT